MSAAHGLAARALRLLDPEDAHGLAISALKAGLGPLDRHTADPILATSFAGLTLPNPIGLAAGFDKNAEVPGPMLAAGFGFVECGTATPRPQAGNARPRLFRLRQDRAVINRMGFNNHGLDVFADNLRARRRFGVVGANIGVNKDAADRIQDYVDGLSRLWGLCDYFTVNVSSPNTAGLRELQAKGALTDLLGALAEARATLSRQGAAPVFLKVAPDLDDTAVEDIAQSAARFGLDGLIISNTTLARPPDLRGRARGESGGLSGAPLMAPSTRLLGLFHQAAAGGLTLIGVGGISSGADAYAKIRAGASAVQLYSALVFHGLDLVATVRRELAERLRSDGFRTVAEAVGAR
jgi:dihydroorotate dehydrogenase